MRLDSQSLRSLGISGSRNRELLSGRQHPTILTSSMFGFGQDKAPRSITPAPLSWFPHAVVFGGPSLVGNGYQALARSVGAGVLLNSRHVVGDLQVRRRSPQHLRLSRVW